MMFQVTEILTGESVLQFREEQLTGIRCRISPGRLIRRIDNTPSIHSTPNGCPFCPDHLFTDTPVFESGRRIEVGESITFPNKFPFARWHTVTVITREHTVDRFTKNQLADAFNGQIQALMNRTGFASINWNYLPSAGASLAHPHLQGLVDRRPPPLVDHYIMRGRAFHRKNGVSYWDAWKEQEMVSDRFLFGDEIVWCAHAVPIGEREVRGHLPFSSIHELDPYVDLLAGGILRIIELYRSLGTWAFNLSVFFDRPGPDRDFRAFCSLISRINPNSASLSDTAFMERLHLEPVILTLPEELGRYYRREMGMDPNQSD